MVIASCPGEDGGSWTAQCWARYWLCQRRLHKSPPTGRRFIAASARMARSFSPGLHARRTRRRTPPRRAPLLRCRHFPPTRVRHHATNCAIASRPRSRDATRTRWPACCAGTASALTLRAVACARCAIWCSGPCSRWMAATTWATPNAMRPRARPPTCCACVPAATRTMVCANTASACASKAPATGSSGNRTAAASGRAIIDCYHSRFPHGSRAMAQSYPEYIWQNGRIKPWAEATVHVMAHALHYGSSVFEGIRCYETPQGPAIFRLTDHIKRLFHSAKIYDIAIPYSLDELNAACREVIKANELSRAYLRPIAFRGLGGFGLSAETPIDVAVASWEMGAYLGAGVLEAGIDACVSSWQRFAPNTIPAGAKAGGNYLSGQLVAREARRLGFGEGIALASTGLLSEGAGENLFLVFDGALHTTPISAALLNGITRSSIITLARATGIEVVERDIPREYLYLCDELFMCGTAAEITPIRSVDGKPVGAGKPGPVTHRIQELFFGLFDGHTEDRWGWLEPVDPRA